MYWFFPLINPKVEHQLKHYKDKISEEIEEYEIEENLEKQATQVIDIWHATETFVRKFFLEHPELDADEIKQKVILKNKERKYYE